LILGKDKNNDFPTNGQVKFWIYD